MDSLNVQLSVGRSVGRYFFFSLSFALAIVTGRFFARKSNRSGPIKRE